MPTQHSLPGWFHVTASALNGRSGPSTKARIKYTRPRGFNLYLRRSVTGDGRTWFVSRFGTYYAAEYLTPGKAPAPKKVASPVPGHGKGYAYGVRDRRYICGWHTGQDWPASTGSPIVAVKGGRVRIANWGGAYGNWTVIDDGSHEWAYCHQSRRAVRVGQKVKAGQVIGYVGTSGNVTGPHLHLEKSRGRRWAYAHVQRPTW